MKRANRLLAAPAVALAAGALATSCVATSAAAAPTPLTPTPPAAPTPPAGTPVAGHMKLELQKVGGLPLFALMGKRIVLRGVVTPYVSGQTVKVSFYREARKIDARIVTVLPMRNGSGQFRISFASRDAGLVQARAAHYATSQQAEFTARSPRFRFVWPNLGPGSQGQSVRLLQSELNALHYVVPLSGTFDEGTGRALVAFRKMTGLGRVEYAGTDVFERIAHGGGSFHVHYPGDGRHVEADLTRQVLAEIERGGRVRALYTMSSGKPSTPTVIGRFQVYSKTPGENSHGMVDSNYFIRGYAIHGYHEVPTYAASHGCLRIPIPDAAAVFGWVQTGTPVDVYNESGGGSHRVSGQAGP
ncbi:MAG TPA: L,D-transpeptidase family protein [Solirubrobacteraceae bacterium]|nr:L,D-transpeptidase family protein [Solirubrobacteraceae bacterium]